MNKYIDKNKLQEYTDGITEKYKSMFATKSEIGAPLTASTAASMTDTTKIYVYTGSESGYTSGNWYYYDGTEWVSGGVYNSSAVETDTTLSVVGQAADAKAAGDAIAAKYTKPAGGIPSTDLDSTTQAALTAASAALQPGDIDTTLAVTGKAADAKAAGDAIDGQRNDVGVIGHYEKTLNADGEICRLNDPVTGSFYLFKTTADAKIAKITFYEFYLNGTHEELYKIDTTKEVNQKEGTYIYVPSAANIDYVRVYAKYNTESSGDGHCSCTVFGGSASSLASVVMSEGVMSSNLFLDSTHLYGFSSVKDLTPNRIYRLSTTLTEVLFADLPSYGENATIAVFCPDTRYTSLGFTVYMYVDAELNFYIGFRGASNITWKAINTDIVFKSAAVFSKTMSSSGEIWKFYPTTGKKYDIAIYGNAHCSTITIYEFLQGGTNTQLYQARYEQAIYYHYEPNANADYVRIYENTNRGTDKITINVIESTDGNTLSAAVEAVRNNYVDISLSKEFAAVKQFTVIGDSMASGYYKYNGTQHGRNIDYSWPQIMAKMYGQTAINASKSGATTKSWWTDSEGNCKANVTASNKSQVYIVGIGTNDYRDVSESDITAAQIGSSSDINTSDYTQNADSFWGNYAKILQYIHDVAPNAQIICLTIPAPRPDTAWKQTAIREICGLQMFSGYVSLCDLVGEYKYLSENMSVAGEMWENHFTPMGYANSAEFLMYALSRTMRRSTNIEKFINLPQIPYDSVRPDYENVIEEIQVNGVPVTPVNKTVNIVVSGSGGGGISIASNAWAHNSIYRGASLGNEVTAAQWAAIGAGTFEDLFIGDYWTIDNILWYIAGFKYWLGSGDVRCDDSHVVIVPGSVLVTGTMNSSETVSGAYTGSRYYGSTASGGTRAQCEAIINGAFGSEHILSHRERLANGVSGGYENSSDWYDSTFDLMTEIMVYGSRIYSNSGKGTNVPESYPIGKTQLPLFMYNPSLINIGEYWWLRDVAATGKFCGVHEKGIATALKANNSAAGMRPAFGIKAAS